MLYSMLQNTSLDLLRTRATLHRFYALASRWLKHANPRQLMRRPLQWLHSANQSNGIPTRPMAMEGTTIHTWGIRLVTSMSSTLSAHLLCRFLVTALATDELGSKGSRLQTWTLSLLSSTLHYIRCGTERKQEGMRMMCYGGLILSRCVSIPYFGCVLILLAVGL
jgi:hypothetical protein